MTLQSTTFVGIDLSTGRQPFTFAALDERQRILAFGEGEMVDALSYIAGLGRAVVAVNGPPRLNCGLMANAQVRAALDPPPEAGRWRDLRVAEYELAVHGLAVPRTPTRPESSPLWMRIGFRFYERLAGELGFVPFEAGAGECERRCLEVQADGCYWSLLHVAPFDALSLEGRIQRQLALDEIGLEVPDAMRFFEEVTRFKLLRSTLPDVGLYTTAELNALVGAYTAWLAGNESARLRTVGQAEEGLIYLPRGG
ncbi:MAG TPA: hypothetical protein VFF68_10195 [Anaerolineaceae bacterium]|nr:hypothetical protein [Anaerolineaceae bacterium]